MRRSGPRPLGLALDRALADLAPATLLVAVQRVWRSAAGEQIAAHCEPDGERAGVISVACSSAVWAQELDLLSEHVIKRLNDLLERPAVTGLRPQTRGVRG